MTGRHPSGLSLSEYVDDSRDAAERADVTEHLVRCRACRGLAADFSELRRASAALGDVEPPARTWPQIENRIGQSMGAPPSAIRATTDRRVTMVWLAAAAALVLATASSVWLVRAPLNGETVSATETATAQTVEAELAQAEQHYEKAISGLEQIANAEKGALDSRTAATLQENIGVVDQAISESRAALNAQPASDPARRSLLDSFKAKVELLQNTIALINDMRTGDDAGAAQVISRMKRGN
jgi:anti-sigma factor RsiW